MSKGGQSQHEKDLDDIISYHTFAGKRAEVQAKWENAAKTTVNKTKDAGLKDNYATSKDIETEEAIGKLFHLYQVEAGIMTEGAYTGLGKDHWAAEARVRLGRSFEAVKKALEEGQYTDAIALIKSQSVRQMDAMYNSAHENKMNLMDDDTRMKYAAGLAKHLTVLAPDREVTAVDVAAKPGEYLEVLSQLSGNERGYTKKKVAGKKTGTHG